MVAVYDLVWGRTAERTRTKESMNGYSLPRGGRIGKHSQFREISARGIIQAEGYSPRQWDQSPLAPRLGGERERVRGETDGFNPLTPALSPFSGGEGYMYIISEKYASV
jgi:hypothetical protein